MNMQKKLLQNNYWEIIIKDNYFFNFYNKVQEIINRDKKSISMYKNLKSPMNQFKRIHLTDNYILLFIIEKKHVVFIDIKHFDNVYRK